MGHLIHSRALARSTTSSQPSQKTNELSPTTFNSTQIVLLVTFLPVRVSGKPCRFHKHGNNLETGPRCSLHISSFFQSWTGTVSLQHLIRSSSPAQVCLCLSHAERIFVQAKRLASCLSWRKILAASAAWLPRTLRTINGILSDAGCIDVTYWLFCCLRYRGFRVRVLREVYEPQARSSKVCSSL